MSPLKRALVFLALAECIILGHAISIPAIARPPEPVKAAKPKFPLSRDITYATGPLDKHGYVDYAAALNERLSKGVTAANNANVLLWQALGPKKQEPPIPPRFFKMMGMEPPPEKGHYYIDVYRFLKERLKVDPAKLDDKFEADLEQVESRPWTAKAYPQFAAWIKANDSPLNLVVKASRRPKFYLPIVPVAVKDEDFSLISVNSIGLMEKRSLASALITRAMLHVGEGRFEQAWEDLLACHRLGRLVARGGTLMEGLVGISIESMACHAGQVVLDQPRLGARQLQLCLRDLQALPIMPTLAGQVDLGERFMLLDIINGADRRGIRWLETVVGADLFQGLNDKQKRQIQDIDWTPALRTANQWYDRIVAAMANPDRAAGRKALEKLETEVPLPQEALLDKLFDKDATAQTRGQIVGNQLIRLVMPAFFRLSQAGQRVEQLKLNLHVGFALAAYQREHGRYPDKLAVLAPKYLGRVPEDLYSGKALIYRAGGNGFLLYSVGPNGQDDGGRGPEDDPAGDDWSVRIPLPPLPPR